MSVIIVIAVVGWVIFAALGMYIAGQKGRPDAEGIILGFVFGPLGCLIEALLPPIYQKRPASRITPSDPIDAQVLDFLNESGGRPSDRVDMDAIAKALRRNPDER